MKVDYSKQFIKDSRKLSGKMLESLRNTIIEVKAADKIEKITDCKKLVNYDNVYRIRIGDYRAFFIFHVKVVDDVVMFEYLVPRGQTYTKEMMRKLREKDS